MDKYKRNCRSQSFRADTGRKRYILETVLAHLPVITGSEADMQVYVVQPNGFDHSSNVDEFGFRTNNLVNHYGNKDGIYGSHRIQGRYTLILDADLRDREFHYIYRELQKWLCRLAKRIYIIEKSETVGRIVKGVLRGDYQRLELKEYV